MVVSDEAGSASASSGGRGKRIAVAAAAIVTLAMFYISGIGRGGASREQMETVEAAAPTPAAIDEVPVAMEPPPVPGTLDDGFRTELGANGRIYTLARAPDGKILVAGGYGKIEIGYLSSSEIYEPATGSWTVTGDLNTARAMPTVFVLPGSPSGSGRKLTFQM